MFFDDNHMPRAEVIRAARKQGQVDREQGQACTDRRNGALMRNDPLLARLFMAYTKVPAPERAAFVERALAAGKAVPV